MLFSILRNRNNPKDDQVIMTKSEDTLHNFYT